MIRLIVGALCLLITASPAAEKGTKHMISTSNAVAAHLRTDGHVDDILTHPAFAGFSRLVLPWDDRRPDPNMPLRNIGSLLPYHTHVDPGVVVSSLNRLIDDASAGKTIFYDIYTDAQKQAEPSRMDTGLFFLRGKAGAPFAVIAPGGGFWYVGSLHEGFPYAVEISKRGYNAFVLKYRAGRGEASATHDLAAALSYIVRNAGSLGVATTDYSLWGSSAGARMAAAVGSHGTARFGGSDLAKPSALVLLYTGHSDFASTEPPTFVAVGEADVIAPPVTDGTPSGGSAQTRDRRRVSEVRRRWPRLRPGCGDSGRRMDRRRGSVLGQTGWRPEMSRFAAFTAMARLSRCS